MLGFLVRLGHLAGNFIDLSEKIPRAIRAAGRHAERAWILRPYTKALLSSCSNGSDLKALSVTRESVIGLLADFTALHDLQCISQSLQRASHNL